MARAGLFAGDAVLLGHAAYQTYDGVLGVRLSKSAKTATNDRPTVEIAIRDRDRLEDIRDALHTVDPSFARQTQAEVTYCSRSGIQVVATIVEPTDATSGLAGFLIARTVHAVVLHGPGIPVTVSAPERKAVFSLLKALSCGVQPKPTRCADEVRPLVDAVRAVHRDHALAEALTDASARDPQWSEPLRNGIDAAIRAVNGAD